MNSFFWVLQADFESWTRGISTQDADVLCITFHAMRKQLQHTFRILEMGKSISESTINYQHLPSGKCLHNYGNLVNQLQLAMFQSYFEQKHSNISHQRGKSPFSHDFSHGFLTKTGLPTAGLARQFTV